MKKAIKQNKLLVFMLLFGFLCSLALCTMRFSLEMDDTGVSMIMTRADIAALAEAEGMSPDEYEAQLRDAGLTAVFTPGEVCDELGLYIGGSYHGEDAVVGLVEDNDQFSYDPIEGFEYTPDSRVVRVFLLRPEYAARYAYLGYSGPEEIENLTYRTITDRNIRVIWLTPFTRSDTGELVSDVDEYVSVLTGVGERIERQGLHLGQFSALPPYEPPLALVLGSIAGIAAAGVMFLCIFLEIPRKLRAVLALVCFALGCGAHLLLPWAMPLCASILWPCLGMYLTAELLVRSGRGTAGRCALVYIAAALAAFAAALWGGQVIGGLQSSREYMYAIENFRGVKLSQALPLALSALICVKVMFRGDSPREFLGEYRGSGKAAVIAAAVFALAAVFYILRTGDGFLSAGVAEQRFRNWLENLLIVRPRTKEFLAAWPSLAVAAVLISRGSRRYALPFAVFSCVGMASVVNTFCHSRAPLWLSLARSATGLAIGAALGLIIIFIAAPRAKKTE